MKDRTARSCLVQDGNCHWYAIPADKKEKFDLWIQSFEDDNFNFAGESFDEFRLHMHPSNYSFVDLQEIVE